MNIFTRIPAIVLIIFCVVVLVATTRTPNAEPVRRSPNAETANAYSHVSSSTFYLVRPDLRRCASPMCGGYFVRRVNSDL